MRLNALRNKHCLIDPYNCMVILSDDGILSFMYYLHCLIRMVHIGVLEEDFSCMACLTFACNFSKWPMQFCLYQITASTVGLML